MQMETRKRARVKCKILHALEVPKPRGEPKDTRPGGNRPASEVDKMQVYVPRILALKHSAYDPEPVSFPLHSRTTPPFSENSKIRWTVWTGDQEKYW